MGKQSWKEATENTETWRLHTRCHTPFCSFDHPVSMARIWNLATLCPPTPSSPIHNHKWLESSPVAGAFIGNSKHAKKHRLLEKFRSGCLHWKRELLIRELRPELQAGVIFLLKPRSSQMWGSSQAGFLVHSWCLSAVALTEIYDEELSALLRLKRCKVEGSDHRNEAEVLASEADFTHGFPGPMPCPPSHTRLSFIKTETLA